MKLLTFLGATKAYKTTYVLDDGRSHTARYCGVALARFHPNTDMRVFVTEEASAKHLAAFTAEVEDHVASVQPVPIPNGRSEEDLWAIFQAVVGQAAEGDEVIFDITHGFRSLPFLSFLAAAYLRVVRQIHLRAVYYGNFELRDQSHTPHRAPVVDLTRFVDLLDWTVAADRFVRMGDAQDLAARLRAVQPHYTVQQQNLEAERADDALELAAKAMTHVSQALELLRPAEAMEASAELPAQIATLKQLPALNALPFRLLADQVSNSYAPLAMDKTTQEQQPVEALRIEREMIEWHLQRGRYVQAVGLAREWLVTWTLLQAGFSDPLDSKARKEVERKLRNAGKARKENSGHFGSYPFSTGKDLRQLPHAATLLELYQELGNVRNDIMHAGKRPQPSPAEDLAKDVQRLCTRLREFPLPGEGA